MTPDEIRRSFIDTMKSHGSVATPSSPLVPENDASTLFVGSGMQPMVPYLLGLDHPMGKDLVNIQPCVRTGDIEDVGDMSHLTFFEMIGRWELDADPATYKADQIQRIMDWQVETLGLDPNRLSVTIHAGNSELGIEFDRASLKVWQDFFGNYGVEAIVEDEPFKYGASRGGRIFVYDDSENWWSRAGVPAKMPIGEPGGPDSEMFFDHAPDGDPYAHPADGRDRFVEIGNNVFMSHLRTEMGFQLFDRPNIDYGGGLERIVCAVNGEVDLYCSPFFATALQALEEKSGQTYNDHAKPFRIVLDHCRAAVFMMASGVAPSNKDQGYVVRRLLRRAARAGKGLGLKEPFMVDIATVFIDESKTYPFVQDTRDAVVEMLHREEMAFLQTLRKGEREIRTLISKGPITGRAAFRIFETYGFPLELTEDVVAESAQSIDEREGFFEAAKEHAEKSKSASNVKFAGGLGDHGKVTVAYHTVTHLLLAGLRHVLGEHVHQCGSNITPERIRFDFSHPEKVIKDELEKVEASVNNALKDGFHVSTFEMEKQQARDAGIEGSFWEKYPDIVTIYEIKGDDGTVYSQELCGGPHVDSAEAVREFGNFRILKEESSSAGVRRIKAVMK